jgi:hypothetical protein
MIRKIVVLKVVLKKEERKMQYNYYLRSWPFIRHFLRAVGINRQGTAITR